jgi:hypothetical protein
VERNNLGVRLVDHFQVPYLEQFKKSLSLQEANPDSIARSSIGYRPDYPNITVVDYAIMQMYIIQLPAYRICGTKQFIIVFTKARYLSLSAESIHLLTPCSSKIKFNIILPSMPKSLKCCLSLWLSSQILLSVSCFIHTS